MNKKILHYINQVLANRDQDEIEEIEKQLATELVEAHNLAVRFGFINVPMLDLYSVDGFKDENDTPQLRIFVTPKCGIMYAEQLCRLKYAWGATDVYIHADEGSIVLLFRNNKK